MHPQLRKSFPNGMFSLSFSMMESLKSQATRTTSLQRLGGKRAWLPRVLRNTGKYCHHCRRTTWRCIRTSIVVSNLVGRGSFNEFESHMVIEFDGPWCSIAKRSELVLVLSAVFLKRKGARARMQWSPIGQKGWCSQAVKSDRSKALNFCDRIFVSS